MNWYNTIGALYITQRGIFNLIMCMLQKVQIWKYFRYNGNQKYNFLASNRHIRITTSPVKIYRYTISSGKRLHKLNAKLNWKLLVNDLRTFTYMK